MSRRPPGVYPSPQDEDPNLPRGAKRYQGPQPPEVSSTALPDPFEEEVRSATWLAAVYYLACVANVDPASWKDVHPRDDEKVSDAYCIRRVLEPPVLSRVHRFFEMAVRAHKLVVNGKTYAFPSTHFTTYVQPGDPSRDGTWFLFHGHERERRRKAVEVLCRYMEMVNQEGCNTVALDSRGMMVFRTCGSEPPDRQIVEAVERGECELDEKILRSLSSSGCALYWDLPAKPENSVWGTYANVHNAGETRYTMPMNAIRGYSSDLLYRPFYEPFVRGLAGPRGAVLRKRLGMLDYVEVRLPWTSMFLSRRTQSGGAADYRPTESTVCEYLSAEYTRHEAEMHAFAVMQESLVMPVVFANSRGWVAISDAELRRTVTSWYVDETGYLGPEEMSDMIAQFL